MQEEWRDIKGYEGLYQVSNLGRVKSLERYVWNGKAYAHKNEKIMSLDKLKNGYLTANLYKNNISKRHYIHRLVAQAFLSKSEKHTEINHKDENKANNCIDNLEWCTHKENMNSGTCIERRKSNMDFFAAAKKRSNEHLIKLNKSRAKPVMCIDTKEKYESITIAAQKSNLLESHICQCCNGKRKRTGGYKWRYLDAMEI